MVIETVAEREKTSMAVLAALERHASKTYADEIAQTLEASGIDLERALWTVWRLIDENRLFLDVDGHLVLHKPKHGE